MKRVGLLFSLLFLLLAYSKADDPGAIEYNDFLICWQDHLEEAVMSLEEHINNGDETKAYKALGQIDTVIQMAKASIKIREAFADETAYKEAALDWWEFYAQVFTYDYRNVLEISFHKNQSNKNLIRLRGLLKNISIAEKLAVYEFKVAQKQFALKYDLFLE